MARRLIDANDLIDFANNQKDKVISANDISRFPTALVFTHMPTWHFVYKDKDNLPEPYRDCVVLRYTDDYSNLYGKEVTSRYQLEALILYRADREDDETGEWVGEGWSDSNEEFYPDEEIYAWKYLNLPEDLE